MLHRSLLPQRAAAQLAGKRVNVSIAPRANLRDDVMGAVRKTLAKQTPDTRREAREAEARAAESRRFFYINKVCRWATRTKGFCAASQGILWALFAGLGGAPVWCIASPAFIPTLACKPCAGVRFLSLRSI